MSVTTRHDEPGLLLRRPRPVGAEVAAYLERLIAAGDFAPGDRLPTERELATSLSVSRTSVRDALHELQGKHLLERTRGRGTVVRQPPPELGELAGELHPRTVAEVAELRRVVEPQVAALAAGRRTESDLLLMEEALLVSNERLAVAESVRLDVLFHTLLAQASRNQLLASLCTLAASWTTEVRQLSHATRAARRSSIAGHRRIYAAVQEQDTAGAEAAMRVHLDEVAQLTAAARQGRP